MAGRPRKSDALKAHQGTLRKSRINKNEIRVEALKKMPEPPKHFGQEVKDIWFNSGNELIDKGVLTAIDLPAFSRYCQHYHFYNLHTEYLNDESTTAQDYYKVLSISKYLTDFETNFGLNPRGRANMNIVNKVVISPLKAKIESSRLKKVS
jgi:phage terminase small subunit